MVVTQCKTSHVALTLKRHLPSSVVEDPGSLGTWTLLCPKLQGLKNFQCGEFIGDELLQIV